MNKKQLCDIIACFVTGNVDKIIAAVEASEECAPYSTIDFNAAATFHSISHSTSVRLHFCGSKMLHTRCVLHCVPAQVNGRSTRVRVLCETCLRSRAAVVCDEGQSFNAGVNALVPVCAAFGLQCERIVHHQFAVNIAVKHMFHSF